MSCFVPPSESRPALEGVDADARARRGWLHMARDLLHDAAREPLPGIAREDFAFDAGYFCALAVIGLGAAEAFKHHPDVGVLLAAADKLAWPRSEMAPAIAHLETRYSPGRDGSAAEDLLRWATAMMVAVDTSRPQPTRIATNKSNGV